MRKLVARRPSPALVISVIALFVALGGSSYAAIKVGSKQIVNNSITSKDIKNGSVADGDVKRNALGGGAVNEGKLGKVPSAARADSAASASTAGSASRAGSATSATRATTATTAGNASQLGGVAAASYLRGIEVRQTTNPVSNSESPRSVPIDCPTGKKAVGGGGLIGTNPGSVAITESRPNDDEDGWILEVSEIAGTSANWTASAYVICANG